MRNIHVASNDNAMSSDSVTDFSSATKLMQPHKEKRACILQHVDNRSMPRSNWTSNDYHAMLNVLSKNYTVNYTKSLDKKLIVFDVGMLNSLY